MSTPFDKLATFERNTLPNELTDLPGGWTEIKPKSWVNLTPLAGRELLASQQVNAEMKHRARLHWRGDLTPGDRMKIGKPTLVNTSDPDSDENYRLFDIESVLNVNEANRELELWLVETL